MSCVDEKEASIRNSPYWGISRGITFKMVKGVWIITVAFGFTLACGLAAAAQESEQPASQRQSNPSQTLLASGPDSSSTPMAEERAVAIDVSNREERSEEREINALAAQNSMSKSNASMAKNAHYQTILIAIGTFLLFITLYLTISANRAAMRMASAAEIHNSEMQTASENALKQAKDASDAALTQAKEASDTALAHARETFHADFRPFVSYTAPPGRTGNEPEKEIKNDTLFEIGIKNFGRAPATNLYYGWTTRFLSPDETPRDRFPKIDPGFAVPFVQNFSPGEHISISYQNDWGDNGIDRILSGEVFERHMTLHYSLPDGSSAKDEIIIIFEKDNDGGVKTRRLLDSDIMDQEEWNSWYWTQNEKKKKARLDSLGKAPGTSLDDI